MTDPETPTEPDLSELQNDWFNAGGSLFDFATIHLTADLAIASTKLFWPDFTVYRECILSGKSLSQERRDNLDEWIKQLQGDLTAVERVVNHIHVGEDLMRYPFESLGYTNIAYFGSILVKTWTAALREVFPERICIVEGFKDDVFDDYIITFFQQR